MKKTILFLSFAIAGLVSITARAQAPASFHGAAIYLSGEKAVVLVANNANSYQRLNWITGVSGSGSFNYTPSNSDAILAVSDSNLGAFDADYTFSSSSGGTYAFSHTSSAPPFQSGSFSYYSGTAPSAARLVGSLVTGTITSGNTNSDSSGTFSIAFVSPTVSTVTDTGGSVYTEAYSVSTVNQSTIKVDTTLPGLNSASLYLSYTNTGGGFIVHSLTGGWQIGTFTTGVAPDTTRPTVTITTPVANAHLSNQVATVTGTAHDNVAVASVNVSSDGVNWNPATGTTNWTTTVGLTPGTNTIWAYAVDTSGNVSITNKVNVTYIVSSTLNVSINGRGTITPNDTNATLQIGNRYTITAIPAAGFAFTNWTDGGSTIITNKPALTFLMASNLSFTANFVDITRPTVAITNIPASGDVSNITFIVRGRAGDNVAVTNVFFNLNNTGWSGATSSNNFNNWFSSDLDLTPGTNFISAYAVDSSGNFSLTNTVKVVYILSAPLAVSTNGKGSITPALNGALLQIGKNYTLTATPAVGFAFTNWTDGSSFVITNKPALTFQMASNLSFTANFIDITKPTVAITNLPASGNVSNSTFIVRGKAGDNVAVTNVFYSLNSTGWSGAGTTNNFTNWYSAGLDLTPGTNTISAYALDSTGNFSLTNTVKVVYILSAPLTVSTNGKGSITPALNGALLPIGRNYTLTATPAVGFVFTNWTDGGSNVITNKPALTFQMASNLAFTANFVDVQKPVLTVTTPTAATSATSGFYVASGKASDNAGVTNVYYNLNNMGWFAVNPTNNGYANWTVTLGLTPGTNYLSAYAVDSSGNLSATNNIKFLYTTAPATLNGLAAAITPDDAATFGTPFGVGFGAATFSSTAVEKDTTNVNNGVGSYTYTKQTPSSGQLRLTFSAPPSVSNDSHTISLAFTAPNVARFTNGLDVGGITFTSTPTLLPPSILNQTVVTVDGDGDSLSLDFSAGKCITSNLLTHVIKTNSTYAYAAYSPMGALLKYASTNGQHYTVFTFLGTNYGTVYTENYDQAGILTNGDQSAFGLASQRPGGNAPTNLVNHSVVVFNDDYYFKLTFPDSANFVTTHDVTTNGVGTYLYTTIGTNAGNLDLDYIGLAGTASSYFQFISPNFAIITNSDHTLGAAFWK